MKTITLALSALALAACASAPLNIPSHLEVDRRIGEDPSIDVATERNVGDVIYEVYNYEVRRDTSTRLLGPLTIDVLAASAHLGPADAFVATPSHGVRVYCSATPVLRVGGRPNSAHVCLRDSSSDHQFDSWKSPDGPPARKGWAPLKETIGYKEESSVEMVETGAGFRSELLYQGLSSGVVSILYREYLDSLVRPAFQQDLSYTLENDGTTEISFRTIQITIHSADNNRIRYTLNRGLAH